MLQAHIFLIFLVNSISGYYNTYFRLLTFCPVLGSLRIWRASFISPPNARAQQPQRPLPYLASPPTSATAAAATALCRSKHSPLPQHTLPQSLPPPPQQASKRREHKHDPPRFPCAVCWQEGNSGGATQDLEFVLAHSTSDYYNTYQYFDFLIFAPCWAAFAFGGPPSSALQMPPPHNRSAPCPTAASMVAGAKCLRL